MSLLNDQAYSLFQSENPEQEFNNDLIYWRANDDIKDYLKDVFKALEVIPEIKLKNIEIIYDESNFPKNLIRNEVEDSRLNLAVTTFEITAEGRTETLVFNLFLPKLINNFFYRLNGNLYYPIFQLVDRGTYPTKKTFTLKTLLMPIIFRTDNRKILKSIYSEDEYIQGMVFVLDIFKARYNVLEYFLAHYGLAATIEFFGFSIEDFEFNTTDKKEELDDYFVVALEGKSNLTLGVKKEWFKENQSFKESFFITLVDSLNGLTLKKLEEETEEGKNQLWLKRLGKKFTSSVSSANAIPKAEKILLSLFRILDERTKKNLKHVASEDKENIFCVLRWMMINYRILSRLDPMDLNNKRIRISEYLIHKLLLRLSEATYRLLNSSRELNMRRITGIFTSINPFFVINKIINNELIRYGNAVNQHDLFSVALRYTLRGPQALGGKGGSDINIKARGQHPSYVGRISLNSASASDPGMTGTLVPFVETDGQIFQQFPYETKSDDLKFLLSKE